MRFRTSGFLMTSGVSPDTSTWMTRVPARRSSAMRKPWTGALRSKNCAARLLPASRRVTPMSATTIKPEKTQTIGRSLLVRRRRRHQDADGGDEGHLDGQRRDDPERRAEAEVLDGGEPEGRQRAEAERRDGPRRQHDQPDLGRRLDDRQPVVLLRRQIGARSLQPVVLLVVALEDLHRVPGADRQQQDR